MVDSYLSWGRWPRVHQEVRRMDWRSDDLPAVRGRNLLPRGLGRSYGDCCLNDGNLLLDACALDCFIQFDSEKGLLRCEAGVSVDAILHLIVPRGWFLPVIPGTRFITLGGAIANDIHGKNHHRQGTFGRHLKAFELLRSDGSRRVCSPTEHADLFRATIGGLGLTGLITWAEIGLVRIPSAWIDLETVRFGALSEFFPLSRESDRFEYTVAWLDFSATGRNLGRGLFLRGNPSEHGGLQVHGDPTFSVPMDLPNWALNPLSVRAFNLAWYHRHRRSARTSHPHYETFCFPLDRLRNWNRIYGRRGFFQYQCVVPLERDLGCIQEIVRRISQSRQGSCLAVIKTFGDLPSPGMLSFPRPGVTVALDFPHSGDRTLKLLNELDAIVEQAGGCLYPAKDARMSPQSFQTMYPRWREFSEFVDPSFSSSFWRRVTAASRTNSVAFASRPASTR